MEEKEATSNSCSSPQAPTPDQPVDSAHEDNKETLVECKEFASTTYLKAMPLRDLSDLESIKAEVNSGNIIILKITPLANKNMLDVSQAVNELSDFAEAIGGDIARLGEERIVICPPKIRIWREKKTKANEPLPTAA